MGGDPEPDDVDLHADVHADVHVADAARHRLIVGREVAGNNTVRPCWLYFALDYLQGRVRSGLKSRGRRGYFIFL